MPYLLDRFEDNDLAVLETDDGATIDVPRIQVPLEAKEGDVLLELAENELDGEVRYAVDFDATKARQREVSSLRASISNADEGDLERFVIAQAPVFETVLGELEAGRKRSHWMWFIFPQLRGLGHSATAHFYGIGSLAEARAYLEHPLLGSRLLVCTEAVLRSDATSLHELFGSPDDLKFCSSVTLFSLATPNSHLFQRALNRWCDRQQDETTKQLLEKQNTPIF